MSNRDEFWALKIVALLHDPPDKLLLGLKEHESRTEPMLQKALNRSSDPESWAEWQIAKKADAVAASMDRAAFPGAVTISPKDESEPASGATLYWARPTIRHPLAGRPFPLPHVPLPDRQTIAQGYTDLAQSLVSRFSGNLAKLYLALWRQLPEAVPPIWRLVPADTRMVDHSLWDHLDAAAAVAGALDQPGLLVFSISPVQHFIEQARRTQDLWMGSYILSYLTWEAAKAVAEEYGPDAVLYPALRGQPLVDHWLATEARVISATPDNRKMRMATLPNRLVALLPAASAYQFVHDVMLPVVRSAWARLASAVLHDLDRLLPLDATWRQIWADQTGVTATDAHDVFWELYWSYWPWPKVRPSGDPDMSREAEEALIQYLGLTFPGNPRKPDGTPDVPPDWHFGKVYAAYKSVDGGRFINVGTVYSLLHSLSRRGHDARKGVHNFIQMEEQGEKCTVCGERAALHSGNASRAGVRDAWSNLANALETQGRYAELKPNGRERLCAICTIKRFAQRAFFEETVGLRGGFPSTSTIAAATFREQLMLHLKERPTDDPLWQAFRAFLSGLHDARSKDGKSIPQTVSEEAIPRLHRLLDRCFAADDRARVRAFLRYDGDLLYPETYTVERFRDDYHLDFSHKPELLTDLRDRLGRLRRAAAEAGISPPSTYFGILMMDGDRMGTWLAGELLPAFRQALNSEAIPLFEKQFAKGRLLDWRPLLDEHNPDARRLLGPASHAAISHALANFALFCVQQVVEERYPGRVIYAGGDDLLALLPADSALAAARELRALYSGEASVIMDADGVFSEVKIEFGNGDCSGYLTLGEDVLLTMGPTASASAGIAIAHHQAPLDGVLAAARQAEHAAKETYGRNAVCVYALKRSGEALRVGSRWFYEQAPDSMGTFGEFRGLLQGDKLSSKLAYEALVEARALVGLPDAHHSALKRLLKRHKGTEFSKEEIETWAEHLAKWSQALNTHRLEWEQQWPQFHDREPDPIDEDFAPQPGPVELAKWLLLARFLETGGEE